MLNIMFCFWSWWNRKIPFLMKLQLTRDWNHFHEWYLLNSVEINPGKQTNLLQPNYIRNRTRAVFSEENVCPPPVWTDLSLKKVVSIIYGFVFACVWSIGAIFQNLSPSATLKMGSNQFLSPSQQYSCTRLVKIHPFILEIGCRKAIFQQSEPSCILENGVKVTKI